MHDIVTIQETHGSDADISTLHREVPLHIHYLSTIPDRHAGGISISISRKFATSLFSTITVRELIVGRLMKLHAIGINGDLVVLAVHLTPGLDTEDLQLFLNTIKANLIDDERTITILLGDLNAHPADEPKMSVGSDDVNFSFSYYTKRLEDSMGFLTEISGDYFTHRGKVAGDKTMLSKIDRCLTTMAPEDLLDRHPKAHITAEVLDFNGPSDHVPISVHLHKIQATPTHSNNIPDWLINSKQFQSRVKELLKDFMDSIDNDLMEPEDITPEAMRQHLKDLLHVAKREVLQ